MNADSTFSSSFGNRGSGVGQLNYPYDVALNSAGNVYIAASGGQLFGSHNWSPGPVLVATN